MAATTRSILERVQARESFGRSTVAIQGHICVPIGLDNGNDAAKLATFGKDGTVTTVRIPTAHGVARTFQGGTGEVTYQLGDADPFWIGETAIRNEGRALRVGSTATRLADTRHAGFLAAGLIEVLRAAGYEPGSYTLAIGFAIPNEEVVRESADSDRLQVVKETKDSLRRHLSDARWMVSRTDERGRGSTWDLHIRHVVPQAQTIGSFVAWAKAPDGTTVTDYDAVTLLDIGGGDLQETTIALKPYRMTSRRRGDGTIDIARGLRLRLPRARLNDVTAQHALVSRRALISGRMQPIERDVQAVIDTYGQDLVGNMLELFQETRRYLVITGGGVILLHDTIGELLHAAGKEAGQDYLMVDRSLASVLNAIGTLFAVVFLATKS